ncbi:uncharacterized protein LOC120134367 [Hibiscus syriacus]|uniref:uncharacterized protein LOC120134367 n=1 Tax=Hibiscus syriacus TaxID=106335 RepID=UPI0019214C78|nr:uncharacterized protein LOC120134367 [Hibiscus syriacus]
MKRQRSDMEARGDGGKRSKRTVETKEEEEGGGVVAAGCGLQSTVWWAEQMPWASVWSPLWDVDFVDRAYGELFGDVAWDDDIWGLKRVMAIPQK